VGRPRPITIASSQSRSLRAPAASKPALPFFWIAVWSGIAVLLAIVGTLQYRWSTEIKRAAEVRVGMDLESMMMKWHLDFYGEFSAVCVALQIGPDSGARDNREDYLQRYTEWSRAANGDDSLENIYTNRDLVKDTYIWESSRPEDPRLLRLNAQTAKIENAVVPAELEALLEHLKRHSSNLRVALRAWEFGGSTRAEQRRSDDRPSPSNKLRSNAITGWQFDEQIPAIVHPITHRSGDERADVDFLKGRPVDWVVVVLNLETIKKRILPGLTQRYFGSEDTGYKLAVITGGRNARLLYSSDPTFRPREISASDSVMNIFGPPPESTEGHLWQTEKNRKSLRGEDWHSFSSPVWFPIVQQTAEDGPWMLVLQNRKGALDAAVTRVWRSNLLTGGIVLLLLAASMVLVVIASQRAQSLANLQMDFVASVSHELRTPLAAILSAGQNITDGFAPDLKSYGGLITTQARQLIDLVDQTLLFVSMKNGTSNCLLRPLKVNDVLEQVRRNTVAMFGESGFIFDFHAPESLPPILGDPQLLSRCLQNLIGNAVKYSGRSRWIGVSADCEGGGSSDQEVRMNVADRGVGIAAIELQQIFEPFYRSPRALSAQIHGTGLGLSVTKHLVEAMGGRISVVSELGVGSVFTLHLRVMKPSDAEGIAGLQDLETAR
jgi:signal transduction histidine kinase